MIENFMFQDEPLPVWDLSRILDEDELEAQPRSVVAHWLTAVEVAGSVRLDRYSIARCRKWTMGDIGGSPCRGTIEVMRKGDGQIIYQCGGCNHAAMVAGIDSERWGKYSLVSGPTTMAQLDLWVSRNPDGSISPNPSVSWSLLYARKVTCPLPVSCLDLIDERVPLRNQEGLKRSASALSGPMSAFRSLVQQLEDTCPEGVDQEREPALEWVLQTLSFCGDYYH